MDDPESGIIFRQLRITRGGDEFILLKFRTMHKDASRSGLLTVGDKDSRVTKVGYFLRKYKLDELPQLYNVLRGDMSIVGPRPEVPRYVAKYNTEQLRVLRIRPGLTDYASIEYANESEILAKSPNPEETYVNEIMPAKLKLNLKYMDEMSPITDTVIIFKTIFKIFSK
jgi:lipopolysaccharide/colanic/teichoic acid biosynthesis glycosyltransferase